MNKNKLLELISAVLLLIDAYLICVPDEYTTALSINVETTVCLVTNILIIITCFMQSYIFHIDKPSDIHIYPSHNKVRTTFENFENMELPIQIFLTNIVITACLFLINYIANQKLIIVSSHYNWLAFILSASVLVIVPYIVLSQIIMCVALKLDKLTNYTQLAMRFKTIRILIF